jgi:ArsR family transcriptional regulator
MAETGMSLRSDEDLASGVAGARFFRVLGDSTRLDIIRLLLVRPHNVSELVDKLGAPQSRISNHLTCLRWCGFVTRERNGRQIIYSIADSRLQRMLALASEMIGDNRQNLVAGEQEMAAGTGITVPPLHQLR